MKVIVLFIFSFALISCGDLILGEKILAESKLDKLTNYEASLMHVNENEAFLQVSKNIFDKTQVNSKCVFPLKTETENLLFKNKSIGVTTLDQIWINGLKKEGEFYQTVSERFNLDDTRELMIIRYSLDYKFLSSTTFRFVDKVKAEFEFISPGPVLLAKDNENYITYATSNYSKVRNAKIFVAKTNGSSLSPILELEFKNRQNCSIIDIIFGQDGNPYILANVTSRTEGSYFILKLNIKTNTLEVEKEFVLDQVALVKFKKYKDDSFVIYHGQDYLQNANLYTYSFSTKNIVTKPIDITKMGNNFDYANRLYSYNGDRFLLNYTRNDQEAVIAELTDDFKIIPLFENKELYSTNRVVDTSTGNLLMYELTNTWNRETKDINIYKHNSLSDVYQQTIYSNHANVNQCRRYD